MFHLFLPLVIGHYNLPIIPQTKNPAAAGLLPEWFGNYSNKKQPPENQGAVIN